MIRSRFEGSEGDIERLGGELERMGLPFISEVLYEVEQAIAGLTDGKKATNLHNRRRNGGNSNYNTIPDGTPGSCHPMLVVHCRKFREFRPMLDAMFKHVNEHCPGTQQVYFITTDWNALAWSEYELACRTMTANITVLLCTMGKCILLTP